MIHPISMKPQRHKAVEIESNFVVIACARHVVFHFQPVPVSFSSDPSPSLQFSFLAVFTSILALLAAFSTVHAAELHLRNGDRITGELTYRADGKIYFRSRLAGDIVVLETDGVVIETVDTPVESLTGLPPSKQETPVASAPKVPPPNLPADTKTTTATKATVPPSSTTVATTPAKAPAATGKPAAATPAAPASKTAAAPKPSRWKGKLEFGFQQQSGRLDTLNTSLRADAEREKGRNQYKASGRVLYGEQSDKVSTDRTDASLRWRHQLSARVFAQSVTSYLSDAIKKIDHNYEQNVGVGYTLYKRDRHVINVGGGITGQYRDMAIIDQAFTGLAEIFEDYTYRINGRLTFLQDVLAQYSPVSQDKYTLRNNTIVPIDGSVQNYRIRFNTTLQGKITDRISMNLRYEYEFDNTIVQGAEKSDQRISSTLGYAF